MIFTYILKRRE